MNRILAALLCLLMAVSFCACNAPAEPTPTPDVTAQPTPEQSADPTPEVTEAPAPEGGEDAAGKSGDEMTLEEIMTEILANAGELPMYENIPLTEENFTFYSFANYVPGTEGLVSEPMMSSIAHSVLLLRAETEDAAQSLAEEVDANKDPMKWLCVEAEKSLVITHGRTVLLVMSSTAVADAVSSAFDALWS